MNGSRRRLNAEINVVPYIDVMLVLLIIFMVTAPLITAGVKVDLPQAAAKPMDTPKNVEPLVLTVDAQGNLYLDVGAHTRNSVTSQEVVTKARAVLLRKPGTPVVVRGDGHVAYSRIVDAMVLLQKAGADKVGLVTAPPPNKHS